MTESIDFSAYRYHSPSRGAQSGVLEMADSFDHNTITTAPSTSIQFTPSTYNTQNNNPLSYNGTDSRSSYQPQVVRLQYNPSFNSTQSSTKKPPIFHPSLKLTRKHPSNAIVSQTLSWRLDPDESLSDWTLTVVSNPNLNHSEQVHSDDEEEDGLEEERDENVDNSEGRKVTKKYFVHRSQMAVGPRRSEYFAKMFQRKGKTIDGAQSSKGTRIELRPSAAAAFPIMLDFMYSPVGTPVDVSTESAVALRHLATCFGIRDLFDSVTAFIKQDLSPQNAPIYLVEAFSFKHEKLTQVSRRVCAENFESIKFSRIVTLIPELFAQVVSSDALECPSDVLSTRVASYCRCRPGAVDVDTLKVLTSCNKMPEIAPEESLFFLHLIAEVDEDASSGANRSETIDGTDGLYQRCIKASKEIVIAAVREREKKKKDDNRAIRNAVKEYHTLPHNMKVDLLEYALSDAPTKMEIDSLELERKQMKKKQKAITAKQLDFVEHEVSKMRQKYEKKLAICEAKMEAQEQELKAYADELSKFVRVPNEHRAPHLVSEYTFQQKPQHNEYGENIYGNKSPTLLPRFGRQPSDGWIIQEEHWKRDGRKENRIWPVYYYSGKKS